MEDEEFLKECNMDGESLVKDILYARSSGNSVCILDDETRKRYYWNTIDRSKKYHVRVTEYFRNYSKHIYYIKEIE